MKNSKNILHYLHGDGALKDLGALLETVPGNRDDYRIYFIDDFFKESPLVKSLPLREHDLLIFVQTVNEPKTEYIDAFRDQIQQEKNTLPQVIIAIGGGCTLDTGKAVANLLTNPGNATDYQGWDLVKNPAIYKIGIPTISGTGAEASRTCVMTNSKSGLKLGMNSDYTMYDQLLLDPSLTKTVPKEQYFYTGMDSYIHCIESLNGSYRHAVGDAFSHQTLSLCRDVFLSDDMMSDENRDKLMTASYLGGCAIANSFVGVVHPISAGLSVVLDVHHCIGNCIVMNVMEEFYPKETKEFHGMLKKQNITLPQGICKDLDDATYDALYDASIIHEKPLSNALGDDFKSILTKEKVIALFKRM